MNPWLRWPLTVLRWTLIMVFLVALSPAVLLLALVVLAIDGPQGFVDTITLRGFRS